MIPRRDLILAAAATITAASPASAQPRLDVKALHDASPPSTRDTIPLPAASGAGAVEQWYTLGGDYGVRNVALPTLTVVRPPAGRGDGAAVVVAPGGGYVGLSWRNEGEDVARSLAAQGITAFILKYTLNPTPRDPEGFIAYLGAQIAATKRPRQGAATSADLDREISPPAHALPDAVAAIRTVRRLAGQYGVDPHRVGFLGFSAGADLALRVATVADRADRPDTVAMIYGPLLPTAVPHDPPPLFGALAMDDPLFAPGGRFGSDGFALISQWRHQGGTVEYHLYEGGGHGFGAAPKGTTSDLWFQEYVAWLRSQGQLGRTTPGR